MKKILAIVFFYLLFTPSQVFAQLDYVLPYPSAMPGSKFYILRETLDNLLQYWYFGNFGQFTYNLNQSDKYLVEAETLFEYKQYLLAEKALKKSDYYFANTALFLEKAKNEEKDISQKRNMLLSAAQKHIEILNDLKKILPDNFKWTSEKTAATELPLQGDIHAAMVIRSKEL